MEDSDYYSDDSYGQHLQLDEEPNYDQTADYDEPSYEDMFGEEDFDNENQDDYFKTSIQWMDYMTEEDEQQEAMQWQQEMRQLQYENDHYRVANKILRLNQTQKIYLKDIYEKAQVKYQKQEFKFDKQLKQMYPTRGNVNGRELFEVLFKEFKRQGLDLCSVTVKTYVKDYEGKQKKYQQKITRIERQIDNILKSDCYHQYVLGTNERDYKNIMVERSRNHQYVHFIVKLPKGNAQMLQRIKRLCILIQFQGSWVNLRLGENRYNNRDYLTVTNNSHCNSLKSWDLGCRVKFNDAQKFYSYFEPTGEQWITFSRSMQVDDQSKIRQICIYNCFKSTIVLKTIIKTEQIYLLSYSSNKKDVYIFLSSPPIYQFAIMPADTYCLPNYLNHWDRVENFLFLKHKYFKENDFLRLFLYSNSYVHLKLNDLDQISCKNIEIDIELIQIELNCKKETIQASIQNSKQIAALLNLFDPTLINSSLNFIDILDKPFLTAHVKWKLSYQIMLLIRFNVIGPNDISDFLKLAESYKQRIDKFIQCLSRKSAGFTNKVAGLNRFRKGVYDKLKHKISHFFTELDKNIPKSSHQKKFQEQSCLIYKVCLTPSGILPNPVSAETKCRLIRQYEKYSDFFLKVSLEDDAGDTMKNQRYIYNKIMRKLLDVVSLLGKKYVPLGWSGSQLRASSLWYVSEIEKDQGDFKKMTQQSILRFLGDFSKIAVAAKKAARIGQAFSSSYCYNSSDVAQVIVEDDLSAKRFLYTDGIGKISRELFDEICQYFEKRKIKINCCLQIRYKGAKGVLLLNEKLEGKTIVLRKSMVKYQCNHPQAKKYLDILSWDKYYSGYLNRQIIILLKSLGISDEVFLYFQKQYIDQLNSLSFSELDGNLLRVLSQVDESEDSFSLTIKSLSNNFDLSRDLFFQQFLESIKDTKFTELKKKSRILIEKSARLIGVIDDYEVLNQGELFCCIQKPKSNNKREIIKGDVIITRNPSLSPADVRKCRCITLEEIGQRMKKVGNQTNYYQKFANCIVFPKKGVIPLTAQISGSDLDGDIFFICWEKDFIISKHQPSQTIDNPDKKANPYYGGFTYKQMLNFFIDFSNSEKLGRINNIHTVHADMSKIYANDPKCKQLAAIHGKAVDYAKSGQAPEDIPMDLIIREYPDFMEKWNKPFYYSESVLGNLFRECKDEIQKRKKKKQMISLQFSPKILSHLKIKSIKPSLVLEVMELLSKFQEDITDLLSHANVTSEFELYAGSSAQNEELKNDFGRKRLSDWLQELRDRYQSMFFENKDKQTHQKQLTHYRKLKSCRLKKTNIFSELIKQKSALAYVISYFCYGNHVSKNILEELPKQMMKLCEKIKKVQNFYKYDGKYLGFIWFIIPKIIINMHQDIRPKRKTEKSSSANIQK